MIFDYLVLCLKSHPFQNHDQPSDSVWIGWLTRPSCSHAATERIFPLVLVLVIGLTYAPTTASLANLIQEMAVRSFTNSRLAMGGGNDRASRNGAVDLQAHLDSYSQDHLEAIEHQIEAGKNAMPPYQGKLSDDDIADVAAYVEEQAERGWQR